MRSESIHPARIYDRWYFFATGAWLYVTLAALQQVGFGPGPIAVLLLGPLLFALLWRATARSFGSDAASVELAALSALRLSAWGAGLWCSTRLGPAMAPGLMLAANLGLGSAVAGAQLALARIPGRPGLIQPPASARSLTATVVCAVLWGVVSLLAALRVFWPERELGLAAAGVVVAGYAAAVASLIGLAAAALRLQQSRRLELGVLDRATGALALSLAALGLAVPAAALRLAPPELVLPLGVLGAALACAWVSTVREPSRVPSALRSGLVVTLLGAPLAVGITLLLVRAPDNAISIGFAGCVTAALIGWVAERLVGPLAPDEARRLRALEAAARAAIEPDPESAVIATLKSLHGLERDIHSRPELWRVDPPEALHVDMAGYLHTERSAAPPEVYELAEGEPERMLRRDVLEQLEVRRPEVRPAFEWMLAHDAIAITLVWQEQGPIGLLLLPQGSRRRSVTLAEAHAARQLAERLSAVLGLSSALARARMREEEAAERVERLEQERKRLETALASRTQPRDSVPEVLAQGVRVATYSARARGTLGQLERFGAAGLDVSCETPVGVEPLGWACAFHLASRRPGGPLVIADGTAAATHRPEYWSDDTEGPLRRAQGGTLVVLNAAALPLAAQDALARALWQRSAPSDAATPPAVLFATLPAGPQALLEARSLSLTLAQYLLPQRLALPALCERQEDLRGLILERLLRAGGRPFAQPLGIEPSALARLVEYAWPGNDAELHGVIDRAVRRAKGERITLQDLLSSGLQAPDRSEGATASEPPSIEERAIPAVSGVVEAPSSDLEIARPSSEPAPARRPGSERSLRAPKVADRSSEEASLRASPRRRRRR